MPEHPPALFKNASPSLVLQLLELQGITLTTEDLQNTIQHFNIIQGHANKVLAFQLDDAIEPAPVFQPGNGENI